MASNPNGGGFGPSTTTPSGIEPSPNPVSHEPAGFGTGTGGQGTMGGFSGGTGGASGVKAQAQGAVEQARAEAMKLKDQALDQARSAAEEGKTKAASTLADVAQTVRQTADQLGQNQTIAPVAKYADQAADAIERFAGTLRNKDVDQLFDEVSSFVRRNPAIAAGVAVAAGFALVRLLSPQGGAQTAYGSQFGDYDDTNAFKS